MRHRLFYQPVEFLGTPYHIMPKHATCNHVSYDGHDVSTACVQALASIIFLRLHPKPLRHTPSYEFTTSFGGVCWGLVVGMSRQHLIYRQNKPGQFVHIVQSRAGVIALLQRVTLGEHI
jgi:hypothetical protein